MAGRRPDGLDELDIPHLLKELVKNCWVTNPEERPTLGEFVKSLWECRVKAIVPVFERQHLSQPLRFVELQDQLIMLNNLVVGTG